VFVEISGDGDLVYAANCGPFRSDDPGRTVCGYRANEDGSLGSECARVLRAGKSVDPERQTGAHPHSVALSGPRHVRFGPYGRFAYLVTEIGNSVHSCSWDPESGELVEIASSTTLPADAPPDRNCGDIQIHPSGRFLYASNRDHESIALLTIDPQSGRLEPTGEVASTASPACIALVDLP